MGGAEGRGNATDAAEFNFYWDAEAAHVVLKTVRSPAPVKISVGSQPAALGSACTAACSWGWPCETMARTIPAIWKACGNACSDAHELRCLRRKLAPT